MGEHEGYEGTWEHKRGHGITGRKFSTICLHISPTLKSSPTLQTVIRSILFSSVVGCFYMCNGVKGAPTFVHRSAQCTSSQGPPGLGYGPPVAAVWLPQASKVIARGLPPMAVARDMMSYVSYWTASRWHVRYYITVCIMYWWYKSGCNPIPGSPFASPVAGDLSTPFSQLSHRNPLSQALAGHPWSF